MVSKQTEVLALIPARGGSKCLPRKNIRLLAGHPLVAYSIAAALEAQTVTRVIVSTDDPDIADIARRYGGEVPFLRPPELAKDDTPDLPVFQHALEWLEKNQHYRPEIIVHLSPTSPLRRAEQIDRGTQLLLSHDQADSIRSVVSPSQNPYKMWRIGNDGFLHGLLETEFTEPYNMPRQKLPRVYWQNGYVYLTRWRTVMDMNSMTGKRVLPLILEGDDWIDIDTEVSLELTEFLIRSGRAKPALPALTRQIAEVQSHSHHPNFPDRVRLLVLDFDGVLTDNRVWVTEDGKEAAVFSRSDGMGISMVREAGIEVLVLSSEQNAVVSARCDKLGIVFEQGVYDKRSVMRRWLQERRIDLSQVVYVGNDLNDLACMQMVGVSVAVQDAHPEVLQKADWILTRQGGKGAVREVCELIVASQRVLRREGEA